MPSASSVLAQYRPLHLNLENQRKQARSLLNAVRAGDARALRRVAPLNPNRPHSAVAADRQHWSLHHAQLVIARELGFESWAKLKAHIEAASGSVPRRGAAR